MKVKMLANRNYLESGYMMDELRTEKKEKFSRE
jgi:hypothetical protein